MERALPLVAQTIRRPGEPLAPGVRAGFAARLGRDPGRVRVHRDAAADSSVRALNAVACSVGDHVLFRHGAYRPQSPAGRRLIDHELIHVLQQRGSPPAPLTLGRADAPAELEADRLADPANLDRARQPVTAAEPGVVRRQGVSYELSDAPYPTVDELAAGRPESERGAYEALTEDQRRVMGWLRRYAVDINLQAQLRGVDARAIAGAIAWEALENVQWSIQPSRAAGGPGKIHHHTDFGPDERVSAPFEVEQLGLVPRQTTQDRKKLLQTPGGSIDYIGAIMQAMAMGAANAGFDISRRPDVLCFAYNAKYVDDWAANMLAKQQRGETTFDVSANEMAVWVTANLTFIELALSSTFAVSAEPRIATVYFATDSTRLDDAGRRVIDALVQSLAGVPDGTVVSIVGHADERGDAGDNLRLSERRAFAVFEALEAGLGADVARLTFSSVGRGETEPAANLAPSRRVRIEIGG